MNRIDCVKNDFHISCPEMPFLTGYCRLNKMNANAYDHGAGLL